MNSYKIVFLDSQVFPDNSTWRQPSFKHEWISYAYTTPEQVFARCQDADIIVTSKVVFEKEMLLRLAKRRLKLIQITATGTNNVDLEAAALSGVKVQNVAGYSTDSVSEHILAFIFSLSKSLNGWSRDQISSVWAEQPVFCYFDYPILDVRGKTLGIVGRGDIGKCLAEKALALGLKVIFAERPQQRNVREGYTKWDDFLAQADYISLCCPQTADNLELFNQQAFEKMKPSAFLINCARGKLINEVDLANAITNKRIAGAALDVLAIEPPSKDNVLIKLARTNPNLVITPHLAFAGEQALEVLKELSIKYIEDFVAQDQD